MPTAAPLVVIVAGAALTLLAWQAIAPQVRESEQIRFQRLSERVLADTQSRFSSAAQAVYGVRAWLNAGGGVTAAQWSDYAVAMEPFFQKGVVGVGYVERIDRGQVDALERRLRSEGHPTLTIERSGTHDQLYVVTRIQPPDRNLGALGLDVGSGVTRRAAADAAMETGLPVLTQRIRVIEGDQEVPGFLLFLPVYAPGRPLANAADRVAALQGWAYVSLRMNDLTRGLLDAGGGLIDFTIEEDGRAGSPPLYVSSTGAPAAAWPAPETSALELFGRTWTFRFTPRPEFTSRAALDLPRVVAGSGAAVTLLAAMLAWALANSRRRAWWLAHRRTLQLSDANAQLERSIAQARQLAEDATEASRAKSRFVAHRGQERRLGLAGAFGLDLRLLELDRLRAQLRGAGFQLAQQIARLAHHRARSLAQGFDGDAGNRDVGADHVHRRRRIQIPRPGERRIGRAQPGQVGQVRRDHHVREIERAPETKSHLVADAHQQEEGEQVVGRTDVMHGEQPHHHVEVQEEQREVEGAGAVVERANRDQRDHAVAGVDRRQLQERVERKRLEIEIVEERRQRHRHEADDAHDRNLDDVEFVAAPVLRASRLLGIEGEER